MVAVVGVQGFQGVQELRAENVKVKTESQIFTFPGRPGFPGAPAGPAGPGRQQESQLPADAWLPPTAASPYPA